jgi:hypothetical protein
MPASGASKVLAEEGQDFDDHETVQASSILLVFLFCLARLKEPFGVFFWKAR